MKHVKTLNTRKLQNTYLPRPCALAVEKIEPVSFDCEESAD